MLVHNTIYFVGESTNGTSAHIHTQTHAHNYAYMYTTHNHASIQTERHKETMSCSTYKSKMTETIGLQYQI